MTKNNTSIYFLRFLKTVKTKIDGHFLLKSSEKFMVFVSKPVQNMVCHKISDDNIKGKLTPQYISSHVHTYDQSLHKLVPTIEGNNYYEKYKKELLFFEQKLKLPSITHE